MLMLPVMEHWLAFIMRKYSIFLIAFFLLISGSVAAQSLWFLDDNDKLQPVDDTWGIKIPALVSCDTIDTDSNGVFSCGTDSGTSAHNSLSGLQGGTTNEYYHLTSSEHTELNAWLDDAVLKSNGGVILTASSTMGSTLTIEGVTILNDNLVVKTDKLVVTSVPTDRVGIGTASPTYTLDVVGTIGLDSNLHHNNDADTYLEFNPDAALFSVGNKQLLEMVETAQDFVKLGNGSDVDINFNDTAFIEGSSGNVGIGTTTPEQKLSVAGSILSEYLYATSTIATSTLMGGLDVGSGLFEISPDGKVMTGTWQGTAIADAYLTKTGDWTGTLDGFDATGLNEWQKLSISALTPTTTNGIVVNASSSISDLYVDALTSAGTTLSDITGSTQCLQVNSSGVVSGTGSACGSGGGGAGENWTWNNATLVYPSTSTNKVLIGDSSTTTVGYQFEVIGGAYLDALTVTGSTDLQNATATEFGVSGLVSCDTIDTNANGVFVCGTDGGGTGDTDWKMYGPSTMRPTSTDPMDILIPDGSLTVSGSFVAAATNSAATIGFGTTTPGTKLGVAGGVLAEYFYATSTATKSTFIGGLEVNSSITTMTAGSGDIGESTAYFNAAYIDTLYLNNTPTSLNSNTDGHATLTGELTITGAATTTGLHIFSGGIISNASSSMSDLYVDSLTGDLTGNADTATALASDPTDCAANNFATGIDTAGDLTCSTIDVSDSTNLAVSGTLLTLTGDTLSIDEGTLTTGKLCAYDGTNLVCNTTASGTDECTDCLNATEIEDIYFLNSGDVVTASSTIKGLEVDGNATTTDELVVGTDGSSAACIAAYDVDKGGWSYGRLLDGSITWNTTDCTGSGTSTLIIGDDG